VLITPAQSGLSLVGLPGAVIVPPTTPTANACSGIAGPDTLIGICVAGSGLQLGPFNGEHQKVLSAATRVSNVKVTGFTINGFSGANIAVIAGQGVVVSGNTLQDGGQYGVLSDGSIDSRIKGNKIFNTTPAFHFISICVDDVSGGKSNPRYRFLGSPC
jgi:hypothetical protein